MIFNSSLTLSQDFFDKMKEHTSTSLNLLQKENILDAQIRWEYLKSEEEKFPINAQNHKQRKETKNLGK